MAEVDASGMTGLLRDESREHARRTAGIWFTASQDALFAGGDEHGYDVENVAQAASEPRWDETEGGYAFHYFHRAARFFNDGTAPHDIEGDPWLAFEWEEMHGEEYGDTGRTFDEVFSDTFPLVFFRQVHVEGITALNFFEKGRREAERR